jgi:hypothetical protein
LDQEHKYNTTPKQMESQQMMELLLAMREDMKANQAKVDANMKASQEWIMQQLLAYGEAIQEQMISKMDADTKADQDERKTNLEELKEMMEETNEKQLK